MAGQDVASLAGIMKDVWPTERLTKQFYDDNPWLDEIERTNRYTIGNQVNVPLHSSHTASATVLSSSGGNLNQPDKETVDKAYYTLAYNWIPVQIETGVLNQADGGAHSAAAGLDLAVQGAISALRRLISRQAVSNGDALIAKTGTTSASNTVVLDPAGYGFDAIERGWLRPRMPIDIGTAANEVSVANNVQITAVNENATTPTITVSGAAVTTDGTQYISLHGARSGSTAKEMNGLRNIFGSQTTTVGNINPATAGNEYWKPAYVDTTTTTLSLDLLLLLQRKAFQKTGAYPRYFLTSPYQQAAYYSILQNQTRFNGDGGLAAGSVDSTSFNSRQVNALPDIPNRELYLINKEDMLLATGKYTGPTWASDIQGTNTGLNYVPLTTGFGDSVFYALNLCVNRRIGGASAVGLTA